MKIKVILNLLLTLFVFVSCPRVIIMEIKVSLKNGPKPCDEKIKKLLLSLKINR